MQLAACLQSDSGSGYPLEDKLAGQQLQPVGKHVAGIVRLVPHT